VALTADDPDNRLIAFFVPCHMDQENYRGWHCERPDYTQLTEFELSRFAFSPSDGKADTIRMRGRVGA